MGCDERRRMSGEGRVDQNLENGIGDGHAPGPLIAGDVHRMWGSRAFVLVPLRLCSACRSVPHSMHLSQSGYDVAIRHALVLRACTECIRGKRGVVEEYFSAGWLRSGGRRQQQSAATEPVRDNGTKMCRLATGHDGCRIPVTSSTLRELDHSLRPQQHDNKLG